eukprot:UN00016
MVRWCGDRPGCLYFTDILQCKRPQQGFLYFYGQDMTSDISRLLFGIDMWGGYWIVGQYLVISPCIDMKWFKWKGWFKIINVLFSLIMGGVIFYFEFFTDDPHKNPTFQKLMQATEGIVLFGKCDDHS